MDPTPPPLHTSSSTAAAASSAGSPRGSMSTALLGSSNAHSQSHRHSSLYPPPLPNRLASRGSAASDAASGSSSSSRPPQAPPPSPAAGGSRRRSQTANLYEELCMIRRTSVEYIAHLDAIAEARRASRSLRGRQQLHHKARPSSTATSSGVPPLPGGSFSRYGSFSSQQQARPSMTTASLPPLPRGGFSGYTPSSSATSGLPDLPGGNVSGYAPWLGPQRTRPSPTAPGRLDLRNGNISGYAPSFSLGTTSGQPDLLGRISFSSYASPLSQKQQQHESQLAWLSPTTSCLPDVPGGSFFGYTPSLSPQAGSSSTVSSLPSLPGSISAFAQSPPVGSGHQQQPWNSGETTIAGSSLWSVDPPPSRRNTTSGTGFVQRPSSSEQYELPPLPPNMQMPLLPVKQESVDYSDRLEPELIYIDDETTDDDLGLCALMASFESSDPGLEGLPLLESSSSGDKQLQLGGRGDELISTWGATKSSGQSFSPMPEEVLSTFSRKSVDGSFGADSGGSMAWNCQSFTPMSQEQVPWHGGTFASCSSDLSSHWQPSPKSDTSGFVQPKSAFELTPLPPSLDMGILPVGNSTWNAASTGSSDQNCGAMQDAASNCDAISGSNDRGQLGNKPWQCHSSSMESSIAMPKLRLGGTESSQRVPPPSPSPVAGASSSMSLSGANGSLFTDAEMERVMRDKRLKELVNTNPKRVKRILSNRSSAAKMSAHKANCIRDLERQFDALQKDNLLLSSRVTSEQVRFVDLKNQNKEMGMRLQQLEVRAKMGQVESEALRAEIESLKLVEFSGLYSSDVHTPMSTNMEHEISCYTDSLHQWSGP